MEEQKKYFIISTIMFVIIAIVILQVDKYHDNKVRNSYTLETNKINNQYINVNDFGIYLQDKENSNNYTKQTTNNYPTQGYILNTSRTKCYDYHGKIQTNKVSQTDEGRIRLETTVSIYCQMYFDIDNTKPTVKSITISGKDKDNNVKSDYIYNYEISYTVSWEDSDVVYYCVKEGNNTCNESEWQKTDGKTSISGKMNVSSEDGVKTINAYVRDKARNVSEVVTGTSNAKITVDRTPPTISGFTLTGSTASGTSLSDSSKYTHTTSVSAKVTWEDNDVASYCITTSLSCSTNEWTTISSQSVTKSITTSAEQGDKNYNAFIKDKAGNVSTVKKASITYDDKDPSVSISGDTSTENTITFTISASDSNGSVTTTCWAVGNGKTTNGTISNNTCTIKGLSEDTSYTIYAKAVDLSGRYKQTSKSVKTQISYTCDVGTLTNDSIYGKICIVNAKDQNWTSTSTYWTCSATSKQYATEAEANNDCYSDEKVYGTCTLGEMRYQCNGTGYHSDFPTEDMASKWCTEGYHEWPLYDCSVRGSGFVGLATCQEYCWQYRALGSVSNHNSTSYYCDDGWNTYSGTGSSLVCYQGAIPPMVTKLLGANSKGLSAKLQGGLYRYQGECNASGGGCTGKVDNFICFGNGTKCDLASDYMYRIIGITSDGRIKVIKNTSIGSYAWHSSSSSNISWNNSDIFKRLNGLSTNNIFIGNTNYSYITSNKWNSLIYDNTWLYGDVGPQNDTTWGENQSAENIYLIETGKKATKHDITKSGTYVSYNWSDDVTAKIGLIYLSDYYFSGKYGGRNCSYTNGNPEYPLCGNSWLYIGNNGKTSDTLDEWFMTRNGYSDNAFRAWRIMVGGYPTRNQDMTYISAVRPVFYLSSNVSITGSGTSTDPFIVN